MISLTARGALALAIVLGAGPTLAQTEANRGGGGGIGFDLTVHGAWTSTTRSA